MINSVIAEWEVAMAEKLERDLSIDIDMKDGHLMLEIFDLAKSLQLPVLKNRKVKGLLSIFDVCQNLGSDINVSELMETDITVAGVEEGTFSFTNSNQYILPFVNEEGDFQGFINRIMQKCYLPNEEYMKVINTGLDNMFNNLLNNNEVQESEIKEWKASFDAIFETNYNGIYLTTGKGDTLSINPNVVMVHDVDLNGIDVEDDKAKVHFEFDESAVSNVNIIQHVQRRKEFSLSENIITDGGIVRVVDGLQSFEEIRAELEDTQSLANAYKEELEVMRTVADTGDLIVESREMKSIVALAAKISKVDTTVLIQGASGVGKGVLSKFIHENSHRSDGPFVKVDCGSIPEHLLESELFGYVKGAFTGASSEGKIGQIEMANHGTLFLDEIGELPMSLQTKLLRVLQDKQIMRVGSTRVIDVDIRVLTATNRNLKEMVANREFREDLFYRLNVVPIYIPSLNNRKGDIKALVEHFLKGFNEKYTMNKKFERRAIKKLMDYSWPGNVRELENMVEYLMVTTEDDVIMERDLPEDVRGPNQNTGISLENITSLKDAVKTLEIKLLKQAMEKSRNTEEMASILKMDRSTISRKLQKYNIKTDFKKH